MLVDAKLCVSQDRQALLLYRTAFRLRNLPHNMMTRSIQVVQRRLLRDSNTKAVVCNLRELIMQNLAATVITTHTALAQHPSETKLCPGGLRDAALNLSRKQSANANTVGRK